MARKKEIDIAETKADWQYYARYGLTGGSYEQLALDMEVELDQVEEAVQNKLMGLTDEYAKLTGQSYDQALVELNADTFFLGDREEAARSLEW